MLYYFPQNHKTPANDIAAALDCTFEAHYVMNNTGDKIQLIFQDAQN